MPRKVVPAAGGSNVKFAAILAFFRTANMEIAKFGQELVNDAIREREAKGKAVLAGRAASGSASQSAVDAATSSALAPGATEKKKPGPPKGRKRGQAATGDAAAAPAAAGDAPAEVTDASALPPQVENGVLDLDAPPAAVQK